jgi:lipoyl(octanoyl) transferase
MARALRIIQDEPRPAAFNMAADRYLLELASSGAMIFLRCYSWNPPAISLGCMQRPDAILDRKAMAENGVEWVARPTGGRAVLHWNDLTYAFIFPAAAEGLGGTVNESYAVVSSCLRRGLELAGIPSETHHSSTEYSATARNLRLPCFLSPNRNEIMVQGRKLVGSAQKRTTYGVLQHGSIPLDGSFRRLPEFLALSSDERERQRNLLEKKCVCVQEIGPEINYKKLSPCIIKGFTETLKFTAIEKPWDGEELEKIRSAL